MHPSAAFRFAAADPALAFVADVGFAPLFGMTPDGPRVARAPLPVTPSGRLRFHLANGNALARYLDGAAVLASVGGPGSCISPNWYEQPAGQVPTCNYRTVEIEGRVGQDWTMAKMGPARRDAMMRAIKAFELVPDAIPTTDMASQNRSDADARRVLAALETIGDAGGAASIRRTRRW